MSSRIHEWKDHIVSYVFLIAIILALGIGVLAAKPSSTQCNDHIDNDGNGYCDYRAGGSYCKNGSVTLGDPGCSSKQDNTESSPALCGNNVVETGEVCDGRSQSCTTSGGYPGTQQCKSQCNGWNNCTSTFYCGDGSVDGSEVCDYNDPVSGTRGNCTTTNGYAGSERCDSYCGGYLCTSTQFCGDGVKNGPESCDGSDLGGATCQTQGFTSGAISCTSSCTFDTSGCSSTVNTTETTTNQTNATNVTSSTSSSNFVCWDGSYDTDGGISPFIFGSVPISSPGVPYPGARAYDSCQGSTTVTEWYCSESGKETNTYIPCGYGCFEGNCLDSDTTCTDSDGGSASLISGSISVTTHGVTRSFSDFCSYVYSTGLYDVVEYQCQGSKPFNTIIHCESGKCENGACITVGPTSSNATNTTNTTCTPNWQCTAWSTCSSNSTQTRTCTDANNCGTTSGKPAESQSCTYSPNCVDTDGGINYGVKGTVTYNLNYDPQYQYSLTDSCSGNAWITGNLTEYYCTSEGSAMTTYYTCPNGCYDGKCN